MFALLCGKLPFGGEFDPDFEVQKRVIEVRLRSLTHSLTHSLTLSLWLAVA